MKNRELIDNLCSEFYLNLKLREAWGLGMVRERRGGRILGKYYDIESALYKSRSLGNSYDQAMSRLNHVKSFI